MAKRKQKPQERPNPYRGMSDAELSALYGEMLDAYIERLEYFGALPSWQCQENMRTIYEDPAKWGLTWTEFNEWCADVLEHICEGFKLGKVVGERRRRLRERERARVRALPDFRARDAAIASHDPIGPPARWRLSGESIAAYVRRKEAMDDEEALYHGALLGFIWDAPGADRCL